MWEAGLESEFRREHARDALRPTRVTIAVVMALFALWGLTDRALFPRYADTLLWVRAATLTVMGLALVATFTALYDRSRVALVAAAAFAAAGGLIAMSLIIPVAEEPEYYTGIGLVILGTCTLFLLPVPTATAIALVVVAAWAASSWAIGLPPPTFVMGASFVVSSTALGLLACWIIDRYARQGFLARRALQEERARSERLLLNVLPAPVAERLKRDPAPIADRHPEASVLFADIEGFTRLSSTMPADELVGLLNDVFTDFDHIVARHGVEKIKTIGDAYMAVAGVPVARTDHLEAVVEAALEMREAVQRRRSDGEPALAIRIGIDTGPVVAGVIGESKFIYDLWGDAVTTASRMESHGVAGSIQVTEAVRRRLAGRYAFRPRGEIEVKGKGTMAAWLLEDALPAPAAGGRDFPPGV